MPALYTHYQLGQDVLNKLNKNLQKEIKSNVEYYNMFNQGWDNLYYHYKWSYYKNFGSNAHKYNIDKFFCSIINYIKINHLENDSELTNMLFGFINHYTLDTLLHPLINYQTNNLGITHTKIEFMIDTKFRKNKSGTFFKTLIPKIKFKPELLNLLDYVFECSHKEKNVGKVFKRSHCNGYYLYRYFITDKIGIKTNLYKIIDFILPFKKFKFHKNTFYIKKFEPKILNIQKDCWNHPNNRNEIYNYSFNDLYNIALKISTKLNNDAYKVLKNKKDLNKFINNIKKVSLKNIEEFL